jgi:hypothetical protein
MLPIGTVPPACPMSTWLAGTIPIPRSQRSVQPPSTIHPSSLLCSSTDNAKATRKTLFASFRL